MTIIHRADISGRTLCRQPGLISISGVTITCRDCIALTKSLTKAEGLALLERAAAAVQRRTL